MRHTAHLTAQWRESRNTAVEEALAALHLSADAEAQLRAVLDIRRRPEAVARTEWQRFSSPDPFQLTLPQAVAVQVADLTDLRLSGARRGYSNAYKQKLARRVEKEFIGAPKFFRDRGRPSDFPEAYRQLMVGYIRAIEHALGHSFPYSRSFRKSSGRIEVGGPAFRLLQASLSRALFVSGAPSPEYLVKVIKQHRRDP